MHLSETFFDQLQDDYFIYLDQVKEDDIPMSYEAFEWMKLREISEDFAEQEIAYQERYID